MHRKIGTIQIALGVLAIILLIIGNYYAFNSQPQAPSLGLMAGLNFGSSQSQFNYVFYGIDLIAGLLALNMILKGITNIWK